MGKTFFRGTIFCMLSRNLANVCPGLKASGCLWRIIFLAIIKRHTYSTKLMYERWTVK